MIPYSRMQHIFGIETEGIMLVLAFFFTLLYIRYNLKKNLKDYSKQNIRLFFLIIVLSSLIGARLWHYTYFFKGWQTIIDFFNPFKGGLTSFGGILGGAVGIIIYLYITRQVKKQTVGAYLSSLAKYGDALVPGAALFIAIFRIGCFLDGHLIGMKTDLPWALYYIDSGVSRHPVALYYSLSAFVIFIILHNVKLAKSRKSILFFALYLSSRFCLDFFRYERVFNGLSASQYTCIGLLTLILTMYSVRIISLKKRKRTADKLMA